jgi:tetratricopeptide (TPR) repeat protein
LRSARPKQITDKVRSKLYLAGITSVQSPGTTEAPLKIKNQIIDQVLSDRWLLEADKASRGLLHQARQSFEDNLFEPAVAFFEEYLATEKIDDASIDLYRLGTSYFHTKRYKQAIEWLSMYLDSEQESDEVRGSVSLTIGRAHLILGDYEAAAEQFRRTIALDVRSSAPFGRALSRPRRTKF